ncbi:hypothetical protein PENFLA_c071G07972 [Penicillium flavigenum]|nr:hypothetical protein PENFLA_c071G07972 [Penicillium flavigenum]
MAAIWN